MPVCPCRACTAQGNRRAYSARTIFRHKASFGLANDFQALPVGDVHAPPVFPVVGLADPVCEDIDPLDIDGVPEFCARSPPPPVVEDLPLPVQVNVEGKGIVIGRQWTGVGRPPNSFFVSAPARLELLLDLQIKHRLSGDGLSSFHLLPSSLPILVPLVSFLPYHSLSLSFSLSLYFFLDSLKNFT